MFDLVDRKSAESLTRLVDGTARRHLEQTLSLATWLDLYTQRFATVEVNNTFYRLPGDGTFEKWRAESPEGFVFRKPCNYW